MLVDGFPVNDPLTGRADLSRISSRDVERVTLLPGAQTVRAGKPGGGRRDRGRDPARRSGPKDRAGPASHGARGIAARRAPPARWRSAASASGSPRASPTRCPRCAAAARPSAGTPAGEQYAAFAPLAGPVELVAARTLNPIAACPARPPIRRPRPRPRTARCCSAPRRADGSAQRSLQWIEARAADPAPPTGPAYDSYTHGVGGTLDVGLRGPVAGGPLGRRRRGSRRGPRRSASLATASAPVRRSPMPRSASTRRSIAAGRPFQPVARRSGSMCWTGRRSRCERAPRRGLAARAHRGHRRGGQRRHAAGARGSLLPRGRRRPASIPTSAPSACAGSSRPGCAASCGPAASSDRSLRGFAGRVGDMVIWAPDFRFIWSPRNFDVRRRGGEATLALRPLHGAPRSSGGGHLQPPSPTTIPGGAQVQYRPRVTYDAPVAPGRSAPGRADLRWHRIGARFPNSAGTNPRPAFSLVDVGARAPTGRGARPPGRGSRSDRPPRRIHRRVSQRPAAALSLTLTLRSHEHASAARRSARSSHSPLATACADTNAPLPEPQEVLLAVNSTANTLSIVPVDAPELGASRCRSAARRPTPVGVSAREARSRSCRSASTTPSRSWTSGPPPCSDRSRCPTTRAPPASPWWTTRSRTSGNPNINTVSRVNYLTGETSEVPVGVYPQGLVFTRGKVFVLNGNLMNFAPAGPSWLTVVDPATNAVRRRHRLDSAHRRGQCRVRRRSAAMGCSTS